MVRGVTVDEEGVKAAYEKVRDDNDDTTYALLTYSEDNTSIRVEKTGADYSEVVEVLNNESGSGLRAYCFLRVTTGDEMSVRSKFALITWIGPDVPPLKKAKVSTEKGLVKKVVENFSCEIQASDIEDVTLDKIVNEAKRCGGANYGVGK